MLDLSPSPFGFRHKALNLCGRMPQLSSTGCRSQLANALPKEVQLRLNQHNAPNCPQILVKNLLLEARPRCAHKKEERA